MSFANRVLRLAVLAAFLVSLPSFSGSASAQELIRRQGILDRLFGGPPRREALPPSPALQERPRARVPQRQRSATERPRATGPARARGAPETRSAIRSAPEAPPIVEKLENARTVLVVGDFLAGGLAEGLEAAYAEAPGIRLLDRSNGSSGFVRDDYYDWNSEIGPLLDEVQPAVVVVMIGSNDRQQLVVDGHSERPLTEAWRKEYVQRVTTFAEKVEAAGIPLVWTGLPSFKSPSMSSDMLAFNDIYKQAAEGASGSFVDIWEGFVDENGAFIFTGPDMNGQPVRLRASDGINLTRPAKRKIAFYLEQPLAKLLGAATAPDIGGEGIANLPQPGHAVGKPADLQRVGPVSLAGPELDGGSELLGGSAVMPAAESQSVPAAQPGRADDFLLPRGTASPQQAANPDTTTSIAPPNGFAPSK